MRDLLRSYLRHQWFFNLVQLAGVGCAIHWWRHLPVPGYAIGVLAVLAAVMSVHGKMQRWQKVMWMLLIGAFLLLEFRAIDKDRTDFARGDSSRRQQETQQFQSIANGLTASLEQSQRHFDATMKSIGVAQTAAEKTVVNTQPRASLEFQSINPNGPFSPTSTGQTQWFTVNFTNAGNDVALNPQFGAKAYIQKPDDRKVEEELSRDFDDWWKHSKHLMGPPERPNILAYFRFQADPITEAEVKGILNHSLTVYVLIRFTWEDQSGKWAGDKCFWAVDPTQGLTTAYPCELHSNRRYRSTSQ
jgi:hypothetical protein